MNWLKLKRHKSHSSAEAEVWVQVDKIVWIEPYKDNGSLIIFDDGLKDCYYNTPDQLMEAIKGLFNDGTTK